MLDKWLLNIALNGILQCHKKVLILWQRLIDIFTAQNVVLASSIHCLMEDENASNAENDLLHDHRHTGCQRM